MEQVVEIKIKLLHHRPVLHGYSSQRPTSSTMYMLVVGVLVARSCPTFCDPVGFRLLGFFAHGLLRARILEWVAISFSRGLPDPGIKHASPALQADSLLSEPPGKPRALKASVKICKVLLLGIKCKIFLG